MESVPLDIPFFKDFIAFLIYSGVNLSTDSLFKLPFICLFNFAYADEVDYFLFDTLSLNIIYYRSCHIVKSVILVIQYFLEKYIL